MLEYIKKKPKPIKIRTYEETEDEIEASLSTPLLNQNRTVIVEEHDNFNIVYWVFFLYGVTMLLPWNVFITASEYFAKRFEGTVYAERFQNYFSTYFTATNLFVFALILYQQNKSSTFHVDVMLPIVINVLVFGIMSTTVLVGSGGTNYFWFTMALLVLTGGTTSFFQVAVFTEASRFSPKYMQAVMSGQGVAGVAVALSSILSALAGSSGVTTPDESATVRAAFLYFMSAFTVTVTALAGRFVLARQPFYNRNKKLAAAEERNDSAAIHEELLATENIPGTLLSVLQKSAGLIFTVGYVFVVTLMVFPSITALIKSVAVHDPSQPSMPQVLAPKTHHNRFLDDDIFVAFHFLLFNVGDWAGRTLPIVKRLQIFDTKSLAFMSIARTVFVPAFLLCNVVVSTERNLPVLIGSDIAYFILIWFFSLTNGYIGSLSMMAAPQQETIRPAEKSLVGSIMSFSLVVGLALGGSMSFLAREMV